MFVFLVAGTVSFSQSKLDSLINKINPEKLSKLVEKKAAKLEEKVVKKSERTLHHLQREEEKVYRKQLGTKDSLLAKAKLAEVESKYKAFEEKLKNPTAVLPTNIKQYVGHLDTLQSAFKFLNQNGISGSVNNALNKIEGLDSRLQQADEIKKFIQERREELKQQLEQLGMIKELKQFNKEVYYYSEQLKEYKETLKDPDKIEKKAIELLSKQKFFQDFMKKNSMLASLFRMPVDDPTNPIYLASLAGLQTRTQVNNLIQQQITAGGPNGQAAFTQNLQQAQSQLQQLKNNIIKSGGSSSDDAIADKFKPNSQHTKSFLKRLEYGTNIQSVRGNSLLPVTSDLGLSLGYRISDKSIIGIGASYKLGWGHGWNNMKLTQEGAGLRSYVDWKIKGNFWFSGGFEMNYRTAFNSITQLREFNAWQESGLLGLSKSIPVKTKFFKNTKVQLLWDFLSYQQIPKTQPILFRVGYNF